MKDFIQITENLAKIVGELENQRKQVGQFLKEVNSLTNLTLTNEILEDKIIIPVQKANLNNIKIAGIDGGLVKKSFHGLDVMLVRAIGVIFQYENNKLSSTNYYPDSIPSPEPKTVFDPFNDLEFEINSNIDRQLKEITTAKETIELHEPDILFLDGSIIPQYIGQYTFVPRGSLLYANYQRLIDAYKQLFETVKKKKTILAGVTEDSRGTRFCEVLNSLFITHFNPHITPSTRIALLKSKDSNLLTYALSYGERSFVFPYSSNPKKHTVLKEFQDRDKVLVFYLKTADLDRPLRVELFADKGAVDKANFVSSALLSLAGHSSYGMPSVLIEADQRAKLQEKDLEMFYYDIINKAGNLASLMEQRRNQRPF
ncbi:MAG: DNA double-strand break repair nuclease NurA [Candidatus Aenigmarchaeota archaeon]|nr:DNA double-strand break repair nuclease NurA [Candidatus Aenigmarchaeota archaeon]